jgi:hypothetical protein
MAVGNGRPWITQVTMKNTIIYHISFLSLLLLDSLTVFLVLALDLEISRITPWFWP